MCKHTSSILNCVFIDESLQVLMMSQSGTKPNPKKMIVLMSLGLLIPIFLVSMAYLAVSSDEKNQQKYQQQQAEMLKRIKAREAAEQAASKPTVELSEQQARNN